MKKIIVICMVLLAISSCKKGNDYVPLSEEDAAAIPYQMGQTVKFITKDNNSVVFQVVGDQIHPSDGYDYYHNYGSDSLYYGMPQDYCYARTVDLACDTYPFFISFTILPGKELYFNWNNELVISCDLPASDETVSINGITHEHVHHERLYNQFSGEMLYDWYYSEEYGLLYFQKGDFTLTRILSNDQDDPSNTEQLIGNWDVQSYYLWIHDLTDEDPWVTDGSYSHEETWNLPDTNYVGYDAIEFNADGTLRWHMSELMVQEGAFTDPYVEANWFLNGDSLIINTTKYAITKPDEETLIIEDYFRVDSYQGHHGWERINRYTLKRGR